MGLAYLDFRTLHKETNHVGSWYWELEKIKHGTE